MTRARRWNFGHVMTLAALGAIGFLVKWLSPAGHPVASRPGHAFASAPATAAPSSSGSGASSAGAQVEQPGHHAETPKQIPAKGWWQIAKRVFAGITNDRILANAAGVTFYTLLAIFPAIATLVSLYGLIADPRTIASNLSVMSGVLPGGGMQILHDQVTALTSGPPKALGLGAAAGLLTSLWSSNAAMKALFDALNMAYEEKEKRSFVRLTLLTLAFTVCGIIFMIIAMGAVVVLPALLKLVGLDETVGRLLNLARWPALIVILTLFLSAVYRYGPSRDKPRWAWVSWGGAAATMLWLVVSLLFSYYVENFGNYNKTYGSLGAAVGFMTWIWLSTTVILIGGELNAEMEHQTSHDTTEGPPKPLGQRGANKADHVAGA